MAEQPSPGPTPPPPAAEGEAAGGGGVVDEYDQEAPLVPPSVAANKLGARSLWAAISIGDGDAVQKIVDSGIKLSVLDPPGALHLVSRHPESHHIVPLLIDLGADKEGRDEKGNAPLHSFVRANMLQAVAVLLARGVNIDSQNRRQETALHVAARQDLEDMMLLLMAYGADELVRNEEGLKPMELRPPP